MWIRSQSLAVLVKANEICIENKYMGRGLFNW